MAKIYAAIHTAMQQALAVMKEVIDAQFTNLNGVLRGNNSQNQRVVGLCETSDDRVAQVNNDLTLLKSNHEQKFSDLDENVNDLRVSYTLTRVDYAQVKVNAE